MGVSADTGGNTDLQVAFNGGEDFIRRIGELKDATARHEDALNRLGLGVAAKDILAQESSRLTAADAALTKARNDAADITKKSESDRDASAAEAMAQEASATKTKYVDFAGQLRKVLAKIPNE